MKIFGIKTPKLSLPKFNKQGSKKGIPKMKNPTQLIKRDPFGNIIILKSALISLLGLFTYGRLNIINRLKVEGADYLQTLPPTNVLFVSNHQTYYADVMALFHIFCSAKWKLKNINLPVYLLRPHINTYYIAAEETMKSSGILPKIFSYTGAVTVKRSWRANGKDVQRNADIQAPNKIKKALDDGWVINFPQGTTQPMAPIRKGTASMIKVYNPIVVPVYINGFRRAFDKKGLSFRKRGVVLTVQFKEPIQFTDAHSVEDIQKFLEDNILNAEMAD